MTVTITQIGGPSPFTPIKDFRTFLASGAPRITIKETTMADDPFAQWRRALAGEKQPIYEDTPWVGYFAVQDRSPGVKPGPRNRWPLIACAIFEQDGELRAERAGKPCPVEWVWPYAASRPITYEAYVAWHQTKQWPEKEVAA